ncbi:MAG: hypothetical protein LQ346_005002 [Caloplaca aetnensis]|nr:MAG: hypothetical protein LQ346_005002 [Caloplaca aetnensis]
MQAVYEPIKWKKESDTSYQPVSPDYSPNPGGPQPHPSPVSRPRQHRRSRVLLHWLWHFLSLLWLAPIGTLLWLNLSRHIIGASIWCPRGNCNAESTSENAFRRAKQLDRQDHNVNGALQFVAKALEVWFMFVAASLVYDMGVLFAKRGRGLPVGYLLTHIEFTDIRYIFNPLLWTSPWPHRNSVPEKQGRIIKLYIFAIITALLTILANLMGPAAAVLVLPSLQWKDTPRIMDQTFNGTGAPLRPSALVAFPDCSKAQLAAREYSCTNRTYGPQLDEWAAQGISSVMQNNNEDGFMIIGSSQEYALSFTFNASDNGDLVWVPNRQVLRAMSHEFLRARGAYTEYEPPEYPEHIFNNSLQTILSRQGPSLGFQAMCNLGDVINFELDERRSVRCYTGWTTGVVNDTASYTKCFRLGVDFDQTDYWAVFSLEIADPDVPEYETGVGVYFADKAMYFNDTHDFDSGIKSCVYPNETSTPCDWDRVFDATLPDESLRNTSINVGFVSYQVPSLDDTEGRVYCEHITYLSYPTYTVDTSPASNSQNLVRLTNIDEVKNDSIPIVLAPDWYLTAWSVDNTAALDGERQIVKKLIEVLPGTYNYSIGSDNDPTEFVLLHIYALGQALSMVNYYNTSAPADPTSREAQEADKDKVDHPIFRTWATVHVWAYGISGRTSMLGVTVVCLGSLCVLARFFLGLVTGIQERSTVEVLAAAFEHRHQGEFEGLEEESHLAKVRYQVVEDGEGKQRFIPEKRTSRWSHAIST